LSREPKGELESENLYQYVFNDALNLRDVLGLSCEPGDVAPGVYSPPSWTPNDPPLEDQTASIVALGTACKFIPFNSNRYLRIGLGRNGGNQVFRIAGDWIGTHIDLWDLGPL
jgi:hypothetical protein